MRIGTFSGGGTKWEEGRGDLSEINVLTKKKAIWRGGEGLVPPG